MVNLWITLFCFSEVQFLQTFNFTTACSVVFNKLIYIIYIIYICALLCTTAVEETDQPTNPWRTGVVV